MLQGNLGKSNKPSKQLHWPKKRIHTPNMVHFKKQYLLQIGRYFDGNWKETDFELLKNCFSFLLTFIILT